MGHIGHTWHNDPFVVARVYHGYNSLGKYVAYGGNLYFDRPQVYPSCRYTHHNVLELLEHLSCKDRVHNTRSYRKELQGILVLTGSPSLRISPFFYLKASRENKLEGHFVNALHKLPYLVYIIYRDMHW